MPTVHGLGNSKNAHSLGDVDAGRVRVYPGSLDVVLWLNSEHVQCAVVSSWHNATRVLATVGLLERFEVVLEGTAAAKLGLAGKPASRYLPLGCPRARRPAVRDRGHRGGGQRGTAARAGGMRAIGVDRGAGAASLRDAGAQLVVDDLGELVRRPTAGQSLRRLAAGGEQR